MSVGLEAVREIPDLTDQRTFVDDVPHEAFAVLRERPGLYWQPTTQSTTHGGYWAVTRHADIREIERDPETFTSSHGCAYPLMTRGPVEGPLGDGIMMTDPPRHTRLRRAAAMGFVPKVVKNFDPWVRDIVREQIERVRDLDEFDYVQEFARTIPAYVVARVLGSPREDRKLIADYAVLTFGSLQETDGLAEDETPFSNEEYMKVAATIVEYATRIQAEKREHPGEDMFTALTGCVDRDEINQSEFLQWMQLIIGAGFETTHTAIGQSMRMYLEDADVREATDRALVEGRADALVNEYLRLISPVIQMARTVTRPTEIAGQELCPDDIVVLYYTSANRDPAVFSEPDRFDPWREGDSLSFGSGVHRCLGLHLAKLEISILFEELRATGLELRLNGTPKRGWSNFINQLVELPVARV